MSHLLGDLETDENEGVGHEQPEGQKDHRSQSAGGISPLEVDTRIQRKTYPRETTEMATAAATAPRAILHHPSESGAKSR